MLQLHRSLHDLTGWATNAVQVSLRQKQHLSTDDRLQPAKLHRRRSNSYQFQFRDARRDRKAGTRLSGINGMFCRSCNYCSSQDSVLSKSCEPQRAMADASCWILLLVCLSKELRLKACLSGSEYYKCSLQTWFSLGFPLAPANSSVSVRKTRLDS